MKKRFRRVILGPGVLAALIFAAACEDPVTPEPTPTPKPAPAPTIRSVAFGAGRYVAVGSGGAIFSSSDGGAAWSRRESATTSYLWTVIYAKNLFVAMGDYGIIRTSPDGEQWTRRSYDGDAYLFSVVYAADRFVAVGGGGDIVTSTDGAIWNKTVSNTKQNLRFVVYGGGKFVAVGHDETIVTSTDGGLTWKVTHQRKPLTQKTKNYYLRDIIYASGQFIAVGPRGVVLTSRDGTTWSRSIEGPKNRDGSRNTLFSAAHKPRGNYVVTGNRGTILTSSNAASWTSATIFPYLLDVIYAEGKFVAVGGNNERNEREGMIFTSPDGSGSSWADSSPIGIGELWAVIHAGNKFVAVGAKESIVTSTDGVNWTKSLFR